MAWVEMNRQTLLLLDDVLAMLDRIRAFPSWAGPWVGQSEVQVQLAQTLVELNQVVVSSNLCRATIDYMNTSMPSDLPEVFYPSAFDETAWNLMLAGSQLHTSMSGVLTRFEILYEQVSRVK